MYLDIRFSTHKNGEKIPTAILRKSVRKNGKVTHQDFGYLSGLSLTTFHAIRDIIKLENLPKSQCGKKQTTQDEIVSKP